VSDNTDADSAQQTCPKRKSLTDILAAGRDRDQLGKLWAETKPADDFGKPLPRGEYIARVVSGELFNSKTNGTPGYKLCLEVLEGEHAGRKVWYDIWLSVAAIAIAKRDLAKLGVTSIDQLDSPLPLGIRCRLKLALRKDDDGTERNRVQTFEVIGIDAPELDPFAPAPAGDVAGVEPPSTPPNTTTNPLPDDADDQDDGRNGGAS
jgi:hypothetical protein